MQVNYQVESDTKPEKYTIENILNGNCDIVINDKISKVDETYTYVGEDKEEKRTKYVYNSYRITTAYRETLEEELQSKDGYAMWLKFIIAQATDEKAKEVRAERDKLLAESDKEMCIDRLGLEMPEGSTFTSWLTFFKTFAKRITGDMAKYRQELRDITKQEGFPFDVKFPKKPTNEESE